ncbi:hypothetical protein MVEN_01390300 [Mycena venus]|uniref:Uncharacterized protein n=1 Tax=Mycena venus TaxID=2733690 RepID=A0A8H7CSI3_9AGAR|nr:hypothetical protein MVEN_01390300 [Mycena venus]
METRGTTDSRVRQSVGGSDKGAIGYIGQYPVSRQSCPPCRTLNPRVLPPPPPVPPPRSAEETQPFTPPHTTLSIRPLPNRTPAQAMNNTPFVMPDPESMVGLPTKANENPHNHTSQPDPNPTVMPDGDNLSVPFTFAIFPRIVIPFGALTQNMAEAQVEAIKADPGKFLAVIPHGAGKQFYERNPHANREAKAFIESFGSTEISITGIDIALPISHHKAKRDFDGPWPMILSGASPELAAFLKWHQTFSVNRRLTFHVVPFDLELESWVIMTISGDAVRDTPEAKRKVLGEIKRKLWKDTHFHNFCNSVLSAAQVPGSLAQRVVHATNTFDLTFVQTQDSAGVDTPLFLLTGKPITKDAALHRQWLAMIRGIPKGYVVDMHALIIDKRWVDCVWCKNKIHPAHGCPFDKVAGWLGPRGRVVVTTGAAATVIAATTMTTVIAVVVGTEAARTATGTMTVGPL